MKKLLKIIILALLLFPLSAQAFSFDDWFDNFESWLSGEIENASTSGNSAQVHSEVNVEANTGGNVIIDGGEIIEGEGKIKIETETIINDQEVDSTQIEQEGGEARVEVRVEANGDKAEVEKEIEIDGQKQIENKEVDLEATSSEEDIGEAQENSGQEELMQEEQAQENEIQEKVKTEIRETLEAVGEWWANIFDNLQSFLQKIFGIF